MRVGHLVIGVSLNPKGDASPPEMVDGSGAEDLRPVPSRPGRMSTTRRSFRAGGASAAALEAAVVVVVVVRAEAGVVPPPLRRPEATEPTEVSQAQVRNRVPGWIRMGAAG